MYIDLSKYNAMHPTSKGKLLDSIPLSFDFGYMLGAWIGNGYLTDGGLVSLANIDEGVNSRYTDAVKSLFTNDVRVYAVKFEHVFDGKVRPYTKLNFNSMPLTKFLIDTIGRVSYTKQLPYFYDTAPIEFKYGLLSGLFDTDGTINTYTRTWPSGLSKVRGNIKYQSVSDRLILDIETLLSSLGIKSGSSRYKGKLEGYECREFTVLTIKELCFVPLLTNIVIEHKGKRIARDTILCEYAARKCKEHLRVNVNESLRKELIQKVFPYKNLNSNNKSAYIALSNAKRSGVLNYDKAMIIVELLGDAIFRIDSEGGAHRLIVS